MKNTDKTKAQLIDELAATRQRLTELEALKAQHRKVIEDLHKNETLLWKLLESASDGIVIVQPDGRISFVNARVEEMFGYQRDDLLGHPIEVLLPEQFHTVHKQHRADYLAQPRSRPMGQGLDLVGRRYDGTEFPCEVSLSFIESEDQHLIMCVIADISERQRDAEALQRTLETLKKRNRDLALLNRAGQTLTATLDSQRVVERLLQAVTETIGAEGSSVWLWDKEQKDWLVCQAAFDSGQSLSLVNLRLPPGQGIAGWVAQNGRSAIVSRATQDDRFAAEIDAQVGFQTTSLLAVPLKLRHTVIGVLEVVNKLTGDFDADDQGLVETLAASAAIAIDNARLVEELRQHTEELEARNEDLDAFAHTVAHDLKSPLAVMIGFAQALKENHAAVPPESLRQHLQTVIRNGRKLRNIINELLLLASIRKVDVELAPLDMANIVAEAQERMAFLIEEHQAQVLVPQEWPAALGYDAWVEEVWVNYISNAIKYGGQPPHVELGATMETNGSVRFWVRDNGPGLTPEEQTRLFTPFTQLQQARAQGHGLGLSIVRRIIEKLNGQVGVESQIGQGSVFSFTLPGPT